MAEGWAMLNYGNQLAMTHPQDPLGDDMDDTRSSLFERVETTPNQTPQSRADQSAWQLSQLPGKAQLSTLSLI
jgi:hypothetical protein